MLSIVNVSSPIGILQICHEGDAAIVVLNYPPCVFGSFAILLWHLAYPGGGNIWLAAAISRGMLWHELLQNSSRERGCCPGRHSLRFTIYRLSLGGHFVDNALESTTDCLGDAAR